MLAWTPPIGDIVESEYMEEMAFVYERRFTGRCSG